MIEEDGRREGNDGWLYRWQFIAKLSELDPSIHKGLALLIETQFLTRFSGDQL